MCVPESVTINTRRIETVIQKLVDLSLYFITVIAIHQGTPRSRLWPQCWQHEETGASVIRTLATLASSAVRHRRWRHVIVPMDDAWVGRGYFGYLLRLSLPPFER